MKAVALVGVFAILAAGCGSDDSGEPRGNGGTGGSQTGSGGDGTGSGGASGVGGSSSGDGGSSGGDTGGSSGDGGSSSGTGGTSDDGGGIAGGNSDSGTPPDPGFAVVTNRYDNDRTGANTHETILNTTNVASNFGLLFSRQYDGNPYAQPLYVAGLDIGGGKHNVVFVATSTNHVYAFDADDKDAMAPYWGKQISPVADVKIGGSNGQVNPEGTTWCKDMYPFSGVTGTPVIDMATKRMYVVTQEGNPTDHYKIKLHALDLSTGNEVAGGPVVIDATVDGTGAGSSGGKVKFDPWRQFNRAGLTLYKGTLYIGMTSHCDENPYHGWLFAYDPATLAQKSAFNTSPNNKGASIWQSGVGIAANDNGLFYCTSNGDHTANGSSLGLSVVRMNLSNTLGDWFTPSNADALNGSDKDLTGGVLLVPGSNYLISGGKESIAYVIDQGNMTHFNGGGDQIAQRVNVGGGEIHDFVYYNGRVYVWPDGHGLKSYAFSNGKIDEGSMQSFGGYTPNHPGGIMTISANGTAPGTGILWATVLTLGDAWHNIAKGALVAVDASDITKKLYDSTTVTADGVGNLAKFSPPMVANGKVYVTTFATVNASSPAYLRIYGLK
jgi:hypothetical protein